MKIFKIITTLFFINLISGCTSYSTDLNEMQKIQVMDMSEIKMGESCTNNLFGAFSLPYVGDTAIRMSGDQSVIAAIKNAGIQNIYAVDKKTKNYFLLYSKRCTIVFGK